MTRPTCCWIFEYGYEFFPTFSAFTREIGDEDTFTQEIRLVSTGDGPFNWIVGYYYNDVTSFFTSEEFTPGFDQFAVDEFGGVQLRPDDLEYFSIDDTFLEESAFFGEVNWEFNDRLQATFGARAYDYKTDVTSGFDLPLLRTVFFGDPPDSIAPELATNDTGDDGALFKFNLAYHVNDDVMTYFTWSEGYRIGGVNSVPPCTETDLADPDQQSLCALPYFVVVGANGRSGLCRADFGDRLLQLQRNRSA